MAKKTVYTAMQSFVETVLNGAQLDLLSIETGNTTNEETRELISFVRIEVEVPRGFDSLSRCRFSVKVVNGKQKVTELQLEENEYTVAFKNLKISYIDTKGNTYFKADDYDIGIVD